MKRRANKKKGSSSHAASTSASKSLKLVLPARCNNTEISSIPPVKVAEVDAVSVQQGPEPATAISPVSDPLPAVVVKPTMVDNIPLTRVEAIEQDIEIVGEPVANIDYSYDPVTPPALKLLADFFTLEDSQDEGDATPLAQKPKQSSKKKLAMAEAAALDEKAQRKLPVSTVPLSIIRHLHEFLDRYCAAYSPVIRGI
jgi:hypothetical protein